MPLPNVPDGTIQSGKDLAGFATELLDSEVQQAIQIVVALQNKYKHRANTHANLNALRDEALSRLADIGILATLDPAPVFYGEAPVLEIIGKVTGDAIHTDGFDHEQKKTEVLLGNSRGEDYLGQREPLNPVSKAAKRSAAHRQAVQRLQAPEAKD